MSVAIQPVAETAPRSPHLQLALSSLLGAAYVLLALWVVLAGLPLFWGQYLAPLNDFLSGALQLIFVLFVAVCLWYLGFQLEKNHARPGLRAGIFVGALLIYLTLWLSISVIGTFLETRELGVGGAIITAAIALGLAFGIFLIFTKPVFISWLQRIEDHGWFHALPYKPTQGVRVRRATVLAILVIGLCGIITMISHRSLGYGANNNWAWDIPFTAENYRDPNDPQWMFLPLMFKVHLVMPLLLGIGLMWVAWRVVNWPTFADFLIATEAEMNKVSWTSRKRLLQDTVVVLVTVFLLTAYLFLIDIAWIKVLSNPWFQVLHVDFKAAQQSLQEKTNKW